MRVQGSSQLQSAGFVGSVRRYLSCIGIFLIIKSTFGTSTARMWCKFCERHVPVGHPWLARGFECVGMRQDL